MSVPHEQSQSASSTAQQGPSLLYRHMWRFIFLIAAVTLFATSTTFANQEAFRTAGPSSWPSNQPPPMISIAPNTVAGLASLGFAVAGGLALVAAALVKENGSQGADG